ncbi:MAG: hypothetical protein ACE15D_13735 [Candidatus Eisenbacteria bacterium]
MKTLLVLACVGLAFLFAGCTEDQAPPPSPINADLGSDALGGTALGRPGLLPGGYYSLFFSDDPGGYSDLRMINFHNGRAGDIQWVLRPDPYPGQDPEAMGPLTFGICFDVDGTIYATMNLISFDPTKVESRLSRIDSKTGEVTIIGDPVPFNTAGSDIDACGNMYVCGFQVNHLGYIWGNSYLWKIDKATGVFTQIGDTGHTNWMDLAFDSHGTLWGTFDNELYTIDTETGASTLVTPIYNVPEAGPPHHQEVMSIAFDDHDVLHGTGLTTFWDPPDGSPVMRIDTETGWATFIGYTMTKYANHGGDIMPSKVKVAHLNDEGEYQCIEISLDALPKHLAHGDYVPGTVEHPDCDCP